MAEVPLTRGLVALVDDADLDLVSAYRWNAFPAQSVRENWYVQANIGGRTVRMHRLIMAAPPGVEVDHRNRNGLDNRRENLRLCSRQLNCANTPRPRMMSPFRGVSWYARKRKWRAAIVVEKRHYSLGYYFDPEEAARAYDRAARHAFGEFATLNFPHDQLLLGTVRCDLPRRAA